MSANNLRVIVHNAPIIYVEPSRQSDRGYIVTVPCDRATLARFGLPTGYGETLAFILPKVEFTPRTREPLTVAIHGEPDAERPINWRICYAVVNFRAPIYWPGHEGHGEVPWLLRADDRG